MKTSNKIRTALPSQKSREEIKVKEKKTNQSSSKRDAWASLRSQLGLLSSPVEHEQVSMVSAVDAPKDAAPQTENLPQEEQKDSVEMQITAETEESVVVDIHVVEGKTDHDSAFDFDDFGDCDIPPNAFGKPKKATASAVAESSGEKIQDAEISVAVKDEIPVAEIESGEAESPLDPFASDELPTSFWQPRKPASIAKPTAKPSVEFKPASTDSLNRPPVSPVKSEDRRRDGETESALSDDLAKHSSGKKRRERGRGYRESSDDQPSLEPNKTDMFESPHKTREDKSRRPRKDFAEKRAFDDVALGDVALDYDADIDDLRVLPPAVPKFEESQPPKRRDRKPGTANSRFEGDELSFGSMENETQGRGFGAGLSENKSDFEFGNSWFEDETKETAKSRAPSAPRRQDRQPRPEAEHQPRHDRKPVSEDEVLSAGHSRTKPATRQTPAPRHDDKPAPAASTQKIAVPNWDDAVGGIIERNMQRRPTKGDQRGNSGGDRGNGDRGNSGGGRGRRR